MNTRITGLLLGALAAAGGTCSVQAQSQDQLVANREKKLASEFLQVAPWITDYDAARAEAEKTGKPIFAYFTRSYSP